MNVKKMFSLLILFSFFFSVDIFCREDFLESEFDSSIERVLDAKLNQVSPESGVIEPDYVKAHQNLAIAYVEKGDYQKAITHCDKAVALGADVQPRLLELLKPFR